MMLFYVFLPVVTYFVTRAVMRSFRPEFGGCPNAGILWLHPFRALSLFVGRWFPLHYQIGYYRSEFRFYNKYGSTALGSVLPWGATPTLWLADAQAIKAITCDVSVFEKDVEAYEVLHVYGRSMIGTEGAEWKRHRRVAGSAFNEGINALAWMETTRILKEWTEELDSQVGSNGTISLSTVEDLTQLTLLIVACAGFGRREPWKEDISTATLGGHKLRFRAAVLRSVAIESLLINSFAPSWLARLRLPWVSRIVSETSDTYEALRVHMLDLVSLSRAWMVDGKVDSGMGAGILRNLVEASTNELDGDRKSLTDDEVLSDIFTFLIAGHETSAHALSFAIGLLALYPDVQDKIFKETLDVWPHGLPEIATPASYKECMPKLVYTLATLHESMRLFPPLSRFAKVTRAETTLVARRFIRNKAGQPDKVKAFSIPVEPGSIVIVDIMALHRNPLAALYWGEDVEEFKPERFIDTETYSWPRDAFFTFSGGARSCVGQRFALAEGVCILASLVRRYEIILPSHLVEKPFEEQRRLLLRWKPGLTIVPMDCRVRLRRRGSCP
ncbi:cytochrome P450 [Roridomyces roridus]|uniref:Cytochrome P450 n=1 Tax=Roridomyces roridus TaxID=1738132 RepID=A0AAD7BYV1_9AGAR|nr:cytochrome P450 [Roridomyces roridus]